YHLKCRGIQVMIKDHDFKSISRQVVLERPTQFFKEIFDTAIALVEKYWRFEKNIRMLTVTGINLIDESSIEPEQLTIFEETNHEKREKLERVEAVMDRLKEKYGSTIINTGTAIKSPDDPFK
ncbi:MAG: DNA polymerase IV, partial [Eubacterium sp.]